MHWEVVDHGKIAFKLLCLVRVKNWEILPVSNFWQLHALPPPSAIKIVSSCTLGPSYG